MYKADAVIAVFARAPVPGKVKTRLVPFITHEQAAQLQREFIHDRLQTCAGIEPAEIQLWCSPDTGDEFFEGCRRRYGVELHDQQGVCLGERMQAAVLQLLGRYHKVIIIGTDAPALDAGGIGAAIETLDQTDCVIVPAEDGGYVLLGFSDYRQGLLESIDWGTPHVLEQTCDRLARCQLDYRLLAPSWDVDRPEDYRRYMAFRSAK